MNFSDTQFDPVLPAVAWLIWLPLLLRCIWRAPWRCLGQDNRVHFWLGAIVVLMFLWSIRAGVQPGLELHLLGANLLMLAFGPELAFVALNLVVAGITLNDEAGWQVFAVNALVMGGVSVWLGHRVWLFVRRWIPAQVFAFIFLNGFFASGLSLFAVGCASTILHSLTDQYTLAYLLEDYLPYYFLLAFSESWLSGMVVTLLVIYRPTWLRQFDAQRYFSYSDQRPRR